MTDPGVLSDPDMCHWSFFINSLRLYMKFSKINRLIKIACSSEINDFFPDPVLTHRQFSIKKLPVQFPVTGIILRNDPCPGKQGEAMFLYQNPAAVFGFHSHIYHVYVPYINRVITVCIIFSSVPASLRLPCGLARSCLSRLLVHTTAEGYKIFNRDSGKIIKSWKTDF